MTRATDPLTIAALEHGTRRASTSVMIKKVGSKWVLYDSKGKRVLGRHGSKADALRQERAIQASKHRHG
jgi:hypothetical protein